MILSAVLNIAVSLLLVRFWGVTGVQIGTLAAFLPIAYGRARFVVNGYFEKPLADFFRRHVLLSVPAAGEGVNCWALTKDLAVSVGGIVLRFLVWGAIPLMINLLIFWRDPNFKGLCGYLLHAVRIVQMKIKGNNEKKEGV